MAKYVVISKGVGQVCPNKEDAEALQAKLNKFKSKHKATLVMLKVKPKTKKKK